MGRNAFNGEGKVIAAHEESLFRTRIGNNGVTRVAQHVAHRGPIVPGEPGTPHTTGKRIGPADHLHLQVGHGAVEGHNRVPQVPPRAHKAHLFPGREEKNNRAPRTVAPCQVAGDLQHGHDAGRVVVGTVVNRVPVHRPPDSYMVVVGPDHDRLIPQNRVPAANQANHVHVTQAPLRRHRVQIAPRRQQLHAAPAVSRHPHHRHPLEVAAVSGRLDTKAFQLGGDECGGLGGSGRPRSAAHQRVRREHRESGSDILHPGPPTPALLGGKASAGGGGKKHQNDSVGTLAFHTMVSGNSK